MTIATTSAALRLFLGLQEHFAFVTDPDVVIAPEDAEEGWPEEPG